MENPVSKYKELTRNIWNQQVIGWSQQALSHTYKRNPWDRVTWAVGDWHPFRVVLGQTYRGLIGGFLLLRIFSVAISVSPHVCFTLDLILISVFLR